MSEVPGGPMAAVRQFIDSFNDGDADAQQALCTDETTIIDDFPPHLWAGPRATARWYRDMAAWATGYGISNWSVTLEEPRHEIASEGNGYVVVPFVCRWVDDGAQDQRSGDLALALRDAPEGWRISAFTWAWS